MIISCSTFTNYITEYSGWELWPKISIYWKIMWIFDEKQGCCKTCSKTKVRFSSENQTHVFPFGFFVVEKIIFRFHTHLKFIMRQCTMKKFLKSFAFYLWNSQLHENRSQNSHFRHIYMPTNPTESGNFSYIISRLCRIELYLSSHTKNMLIQ